VYIPVSEIYQLMLSAIVPVVRTTEFTTQEACVVVVAVVALEALQIGVATQLDTPALAELNLTPAGWALL
jgi:hypothetical protein